MSAIPIRAQSGAPTGGLDELSLGPSWPEGDKIFVVWGYYDESGEYDGLGNLLNMTVGGCFAPLDNWLEFESEWKAVLHRENLPAFHMTDFEAWRPPFDFKLPNGERDKARHNRVLNELLEIMLNRIEGFYCSATTVIHEDRSEAHRAAIEDCVGSAIKHAALETWLAYQEPLSLVFAKQKHFPQSEIGKYIELYDWGLAAGRIKNWSTANVEDICALQAADILAYEIARAQRAGRPDRYPFKTLVQGAKERGLGMTLRWGPIRSGKFVLADRVSDRKPMSGRAS